ncbi:MAG: signal peptidase II [Actinomycetota bacterium]|nr:signal peptidase II [Actinomycetota bacterium]
MRQPDRRRSYQGAAARVALSRLQAARRAGPVATPAETTDATGPRGTSVRYLYAASLSAAAVVVALDQATKQWALEALEGRPPYDLVPGILSFRLTFNSGGAFGLLQGFPGFFLVATLTILAGILVALRRLEDHRWAVPLGMVLGGGLGNALDRIVRDTNGGVVDFIDLHVWPVFNIADMAIVLGALAILVIGWRGSAEADRG